MQNQVDPTFYRSPGEAIAAPPGAARLRGRLRPGRPGQGRHGGDRRRPVLGQPRPGGRLERAAHRRQRAAPLRLERLLQRPVPPGPRRPRPAAGAPLPDRPRPPLLADLCPGHQARPPQPPGGPDHRGRRAGRQGRLLAAPHHPLRARGDLRVQPGRGQRQRRPRRGRPAGPRHLRRHRRLGSRPRRPVVRLRRLVAPEPRHRHHLRMGHPLDGRERPQPRGPAGPPLRPPPQLLVACPSATSPSGSTWATPTRWCWRSARPTTRPRPGGSSGVVISVEDLSGSIWAWHRDGDTWAVRKVITIPAEPADPELLPPALKPFGAVPAADQRHRPVGGRPLAVRVVLGHRGAQAVRRQRHPPTRSRPARSAWAASSAARPTRPPPTSRWAAARRWSRSAATAGGSM